MQPTLRPHVKICCISSIQEAQLAIKYGAMALGFVSAMPSGPGVIEESLIAEIVETLPPTVSSFLLTSRQDVETIIEQQRRCGVNTLQLVDRLETGAYEDLRVALPGVAIVQVIHVTGNESIVEACSIASHVNSILLDSGNPSLAVKELGGTGRVHDWKISRVIRTQVDVPVFLGGGLNANNVAEAIRRVGPFALDVCSGVRTHGKLDEIKLAAFFEQVIHALES